MLSVADQRRFEARAVIRGLAARVWKPRTRQRVSEWAAKNRILPATNATPGPWSNELTPYLVGIMDAFTDPGVDRITFMKSSQVGGTEVINNILGYIMAEDPAPTLVVAPNDQKAAELATERLAPMIEASPVLRDEVTSLSEDLQRNKIRTARMTMRCVGSGNRANLRSTPAKFRFEDDFDICEPWTGEELRQRGETFAGTGAKQVDVGTPGIAGQGIDAVYQLSDRRYYSVPCPHPHCHAYQELAWERIKWNGGREADPDVVESEAWYECAACKGRIDTHHKRWMMARGAWVRQGQECVAEKTADGDVRPKLIGRGRVSRHAGFRISALYSPWKTFGSVARGFVEARGTPEPEWWNGVLGRAYALHREKVDVSDLRKLVTPNYGFGTVPSEALFLVASVDVQTDRFFVQVDGYGPRGESRYLVWCGSFPSTVNDGLAGISALIDRAWPMAEYPGRGMRAHFWFVDSGDRTDEVYSLCRRHGGHGGRVKPTKGSAQLREPWRKSNLKDHGLTLLLVNSLHWKQHVYGVAKGFTPRTEGNELVGVAQHVKRVLPHGTPEDWFRQFASEQLITRRVGGRVVNEYQLREGVSDNHFLDCDYVGAAAADSIGVRAIGETHRKQLAAKFVVDLNIRAPEPEQKKTEHVRTQIRAVTSMREWRDKQGR